MTEEQFNALVAMVRAIVRNESDEARHSSDGGLIESIAEGEAIEAARKLLT